MDRNTIVSAVLLMYSVALRKESVDRNTENAVLFLMTAGSLSARRAWIEIFMLFANADCEKVALRKESVDRNQKQVLAEIIRQGRSPQGERG